MTRTRRSPRRFVGIVAFVVVMGSLLSCSDDGTRVDGPGEFEGLSISVQCRQDTIPADSWVELRVTMVNHGDQALTLAFDTIEQLGVEVVTPDTVMTFPCDVDSTASSLYFQPDGGRIYLMLFGAHYGYAFCPDPGDTLATGSYRVRAGLLGYEEEYAWGEDTFVVSDRP